MLRSLFCLVFAATFAVASALAQAPIQVEQGWARATPGKSTIAAAYLSIESSDDDRLVAITSPMAEQVQLHEERTENGIAKMRQLDGIAIHAGERLVLKPNGLHLMLIGLKQPLAAGQNVPLTLTFAKAGAVETQILVRKLGSADGGETMPGMHM
ncbi:MAG: copper chaperone PCu(A)C [Aliidongia sp.]